MNRQSLNKAVFALILTLGFAMLSFMIAPEIAFAKPSSNTALENLAKSVDAKAQKIEDASEKKCKGDMKMVGNSCLPVAFAPEVKSTRHLLIVPSEGCTNACVSGKRNLLGRCISC